MTMLTHPVPDTQQNKRPIVQQLMLWGLFLCVEATFLELLPTIVIGPLLAVLLLCTYFVLGKTVLATVFIVVANDALGTILGGSLSFHYLLLVFIFFEVFTRQKVSVRSMAFTVLASLLCGQLFVFGDISWRQASFAVVFVVALMVQYSKYRDRQAEFFDELCTSLAVIVALISVHALITGGVEYYEQDNYSEEFLRLGILGAGNGDSNFSGLSLCTGIVGVLNSTSLRRIQKIVLFILILAAMSITLSITTILMLLAVLLLHFTSGKKLPKALVIVLCILVAIVLLYNIYVALPANLRHEAVDAYIDRVSDKAEELLNADLDVATSGRTSILRRYGRYIFGEQPPLKMLFGGNSIMITGGVPHNTYIDWILQGGVVGCLLLLVLIGKRFANTYQLLPDVPHKRLLMTMKVLYIAFALTLSIYDGAAFSLFFFFVFFL